MFTVAISGLLPLERLIFTSNLVPSTLALTHTHLPVLIQIRATRRLHASRARVGRLPRRLCERERARGPRLLSV